MPRHERQKKVNSERILGYTIFIPTNKTFGEKIKNKYREAFKYGARAENN